MKLIESEVTFLPQQEGLEGVYKQIEICGRLCYKSEDKIVEGSAKAFVEKLVKSGHTAMLEHGTVYLTIPERDSWSINNYYRNPYSEAVTTVMSDMWYITTNLRVLMENDLLDDLKYISAPTKYHIKRYTFKFITDRGVSHELVRHRVFSFAQESQRYCNYSKNKYGNEVTFIKPSWLEDNDNKDAFLNYLKECERLYLDMLSGITHKGIVTMPADKLTPQQARAVLPNATKTEIIMTGFAAHYKHLLDLRLFGKTGAPHPDMVALMEKFKEEAQRVKVWEDIIKS
jgi:thymidylate synthase (FAD)